MYEINDLKVGVDIEVDNSPYKIITNSFIKTGRGQGVMRVNLKNLISGENIEMIFRGSDKIKPADINYTKAQFLFKNEDGFTFMDSQSFEQFNLNFEQIGNKHDFLTEGIEVDIQNFSGKPIGVRFPTTMVFEVVQTEPGVKGDTAQGGSKPATLQCGIILNVPLFIKAGDKIKINTQTKEYIERF